MKTRKTMTGLALLGLMTLPACQWPDAGAHDQYTYAQASNNTNSAPPVQADTPPVPTATPYTNAPQPAPQPADNTTPPPANYTDNPLPPADYNPPPANYNDNPPPPANYDNPPPPANYDNPPPPADYDNPPPPADDYSTPPPIPEDRYADERVEDTAHYDQDAQAIDRTYFYDRLAPWGNWLPSARFGWVWVPRNVSPGWRPYAVGHWVFTDQYGWMWNSDERWGWATYHYGRWYYDDGFGWSWVPGKRWAPAWVAWRRNPTYVGWAPIPPDYDDDHISIGVGGFRLDFGIIERRLKPHHWNFVREDCFDDREIHHRIIAPGGNIRIINNTTVIKNITVVNNNIVNNVVSVNEVERHTHRTVPRYHVARADSLARQGGGGGNTLNVFQPSVRVGTADREPPRDIQRRVNVQDVQARHAARAKAFDTSLAAQAKDIESGKRPIDAPAPGLIAVPDRDRRSGGASANLRPTPPAYNRRGQPPATPAVAPGAIRRPGNEGRGSQSRPDLTTRPTATPNPAPTPHALDRGRGPRPAATPNSTPTPEVRRAPAATPTPRAESRPTRPTPHPTPYLRIDSSPTPRPTPPPTPEARRTPSSTPAPTPDTRRRPESTPYLRIDSNPTPRPTPPPTPEARRTPSSTPAPRSEVRPESRPMRPTPDPELRRRPEPAPTPRSETRPTPTPETRRNSRDMAPASPSRSESRGSESRSSGPTRRDPTPAPDVSRRSRDAEPAPSRRSETPPPRDERASRPSRSETPPPSSPARSDSGHSSDDSKKKDSKK